MEDAKSQGQRISREFEELADSLVADLREGDQSEMESFESFVQRARQEMLGEMNVFRDSFVYGYETLLSELSEESANREIAGKFPPGAMKM